MLFDALVVGYLNREGLRSAATVLAIVLSVGLLAALEKVNAAAAAAFAGNIAAIDTRTNLQIVGIDGAPFDERTLSLVLQIPGVLEARPVVEGVIVARSGGGRGHARGVSAPTSENVEVLHLIGVDVLQSLPGDTEPRRELPGPFTPSGSLPGPDALIRNRGAMISTNMAARLHLKPGDTIVTFATGRQSRLRVAAILPPGETLTDANAVFVDIGTAQEVLDAFGRVSRIDLMVGPDQLAAAARRIATILPAGIRVVSPEARAAESRTLLDNSRLNLSFLAFVALLVAALIIYNSVGASVTQRTSAIGILRALGASRLSIFRAFLCEGAFFGVIGSIIGAPTSILATEWSIHAFSPVVNLQTTPRIGQWDDLFLMALVVAIGTIVAIAAAALAAIDATRIAPGLAIITSQHERHPPAYNRDRAVAVAALVFLVLMGYALPTSNGVPVFAYVTGGAVLGATSLLAAPACVFAARATAGYSARLPVTVALAAANIEAAPRRTTIVVTSLALAVVLAVAVAVCTASLESTVSSWALAALPGDFVITPVPAGHESGDARLLPSQIARIARVKGVLKVRASRTITLGYRGSLVWVRGTDEAGFRENRVDGTRIIDAVVDEAFRARFGSQLGGIFALSTAQGKVSFRVARVVRDYADRGTIVLPLATYAMLFHDGGVDEATVWGADTPHRAYLRRNLARALNPFPVFVTSTRELRTSLIESFRRPLRIMALIASVALAVAFIGIFVAQFALVLERRNEIRMLRYVGLSVRDVRVTILLEAAIMGITSAVLGVGGGIVGASVLVLVADRQALGWNVNLRVPITFIAVACVGVVAASLLAAV